MAGSSSPQNASAGRTGFYPVLVVSSLVVAALAFVQLWAPFGGDQALFSLIAQELDQGQLLYQDVWDIKQPGIFYFYLAAGRLFSFNEAGLHLLEFAYLGGSALAITFALRHRLSNRAIAGVTPALLLLVYYTVADSTLQTQVESLIGPLMLGSILLVRWGSGDKYRPVVLLVAGIAGGIVGLFKLLYVPVVVVAWLAVAIHGPDRPLVKVWVKSLWLPAAGLVATLVMALVLLASQGLLDVTLWTWFVYPFEVLQIQPRPLTRLARSVAGFGALYLPIAALAAYGLAFGRKRDWLTRGMLAWIGTGLITFLAQKWFVYLLLIFTVPLAVLAAFGADELRERTSAWPRRRRVSAATTLILLSSVPIFFGVARVSQWIGTGIAADTNSQVAYQDAVDPDVGRLLIEALFLDGQAEGRILVFGDPRITLYSGRRQAGRFSGWSWGTWNDEIWDSALAEWQESPPAHVFFPITEERSLFSRSPGLAALIDGSYTSSRNSASGKWYTLSSLVGEQS